MKNLEKIAELSLRVAALQDEISRLKAETLPFFEQRILEGEGKSVTLENAVTLTYRQPSKKITFEDTVERRTVLNVIEGAKKQLKELERSLLKEGKYTETYGEPTIAVTLPKK